jgi:glycosyltransferase involved in cell wall biosynthesis
MSKPDKKRILLVSEFFYPHWTGIAKTFLVFAKMFAREGHQVTVLTSRYSAEMPQDEDLFGFHIRRSRCLFHISRTYYSFHILLDFIRLAGTHDVVIINSPFSNILFVTMLSKFLGKKTMIYHQGDLILPKKSGSQLVKYLIEKIFNIFTITSMALCDVTSTYTEDYAQNSRVMKYFMKKFKANIPAVEVNGQTAAPDFIEKLNSLTAKGPLVGFAGRFVEEKGFDILLKAVPLVAEKIPNVNFAFAGEVNVFYEKFYDYNAGLIERNKDRVHLLGLLKDNELFEFYRRITLFAISSRSDCFPVTQIESVKCGTPSVVTDIPGARMLVKASGFGEIAKTEDPQSLADAIIKVLENKEAYLQNKDKATEFLKKYEQFRID